MLLAPALVVQELLLALVLALVPARSPRCGTRGVGPAGRCGLGRSLLASAVLLALVPFAVAAYCGPSRSCGPSHPMICSLLHFVFPSSRSLSQFCTQQPGHMSLN